MNEPTTNPPRAEADEPETIEEEPTKIKQPLAESIELKLPSGHTICLSSSRLPVWTLSDLAIHVLKDVIKQTN